MLVGTLIEIRTARSLTKDYYKIDGEEIKPDDDEEDIEAM